MWFRDIGQFAAGVFFLLIAGLFFPLTGFSEVIGLSAVEVKSIVDMGPETYNYLIVDVRGEADFKAGHIPGAVNMPAESLEARIQSIPKSKNIIIYGGDDGKSIEACGKLMALGYSQVYSAAFADWMKAGYRVEIP